MDNCHRENTVTIKSARVSTVRQKGFSINKEERLERLSWDVR